MEDFSGFFAAVQVGAISAKAAADRARADRADRRAGDCQIASAISGGTAAALADVAASLRTRLAGAEAEISRLHEIIDELRADLDDKTVMLSGAVDLLQELEAVH